MYVKDPANLRHGFSGILILWGFRVEYLEFLPPVKSDLDDAPESAKKKLQLLSKNT
jgi:hypothetical protein